MKKAKTLLFIIITISLHANSNHFEIDSNVNILESIQVEPGSKWALNGGIFNTINSTLYLPNNGEYVLLILDPKGNLTTHNITIINGNNKQHSVVNALIIDNKAPEIDIRWENVIYDGKNVMAGPKSKLHWQLEDAGSVANIYINDKLSHSAKNPILVTKDMSKINIHAIDDFNNESKTAAPFTKDFNKPSISWKLQPPSVLKDQIWYAKNTAKLLVQNSDAFTYWLNGKPITPNNSGIEIDNNSVLKASNTIGNQATEKIQWIEDDISPKLTVTTLNNTYEDIKKLTVKVGQKIHIQTLDNAAGILTSEYFGNNRDWLPLPRTFSFIDTGLYRLKIRATDNLGNKLITYIVFTIKK